MIILAQKRIRYEDVVKAFIERNYTLLSTKDDYKNSNSKLEYICPKHSDKGVQQITYSHLKSGRGCYYCGRERTIAARSKQIDRELVRQKVEERDFTFINVVRKNGVLYIECVCNKHPEYGIQSKGYYDFLNRGQGCIYCYRKVVSEKEIISQLQEINPNVELLDHYVNYSAPIRYLCKKHHTINTSSVSNLLKGTGCYQCGIEKMSRLNLYPEQEAIEQVHKINPHVDVVEFHGSSATDSIWYCNRHDAIFKKGFKPLCKNPSGCSQCCAENFRKSRSMGIEVFKERLKNIHPNVIVLGEYINNSTPIQCKCLDHDYEFENTPATILSSLRCCPKGRVTYKEEYVCSLLEFWHFNITRQKTFDDCVDKRKLAFDAYLDDFGIALEYDGEQHFKHTRFGNESNSEIYWRFVYTQLHDKIKTEYCFRNNIPLIRIPYFKFDEVEDFLFMCLIQYGAIKLLK